MLDLDRQLREFGSFVDGAVENVRATEIIGPRSAPVRPLWRRHFAIAGVAAAIVVLIIAVVVITDPFGSEGPFIEEPTTIPPTTTIATPTTGASETTVAPTTSTTAAFIEPPVISWVRVESDAFGGSGDVWINDVTAGGPGLVAVGGVLFAPDSPYQAAIWYSADGIDWSRVPHDEQLFGDALIGSVVAGGPGFVAVGNADGLDEDGSAAVWVSEDGITWSRVPHDETALGGPVLQDIYDVTVGGPGFVAVGWDNPLEGWDTSAAVWTSSDGLSWDRVPHDEGIFGGADMQGMWAVTTGETGLVAVGLDGLWSGSGGPGQPAAVWTSPDGLNWTRVPNQEQLESGHSTRGNAYGSGDWAIMNDVTAGGPGFVAVGRVGWCSGGCDETAAAWTSVDGITWQRAQVEQAQGITATDMHGVVESGDVLIGAGWGRNPQSGTGPAVLWTSTDNGQTWMRQPHSGTSFGKTAEGPVAMNALIEFGTNLVAVGSWESDAAVWIGTMRVTQPLSYETGERLPD